MSYSIPAAAGAAAGAYCADPENWRRFGRGIVPAPKSKQQLEFYSIAIGSGLVLHWVHRHSAADYQKTIDNPHNSTWYRNLVRVTTARSGLLLPSRW